MIWRKGARARAALDKGGYETWVRATYANTLTGFDYGAATRQTHLIRQYGRLRTWTIREWERLAGFPDDWTVPLGSDAARAGALGDSAHPGMCEWLGRGIVAVDSTLPMLPQRSAA